MTQVTVKFVNPPKDGKKLATIKAQDDKYYYYDPKKFSFTKGQSYDIVTRDDDYNGKTYVHVEAVKERSNGASGGAPVGDRWYMPFVSNTVAHAISAALLTEPTQIKLWAAAAKEAAMELERVTQRWSDLDDDIPY